MPLSSVLDRYSNQDVDKLAVRTMGWMETKPRRGCRFVPVVSVDECRPDYSQPFSGMAIESEINVPTPEKLVER